MEILRIILAIASISLSHGCTETILRARDNSITVGRTFDFDIGLDFAFSVEPKNTEYHGVIDPSPELCKSRGKKWTSRHTSILIRAVKQEYHSLTIDGINDAGLTATTLYLPGYAVFANATDDRCDYAISQYQVPSFILGNYGSVAQVKEAINSGTFPDIVGSILRGAVHHLHYAVTDKTGAAIVIEYTSEGRKVHENTVGVATNSPTYDWHMTNLKHYVHLNNKRQPERKYYDATMVEHIHPLLPASGLLGMPGDYSSPSRFIRAAALVRYSEKPESSEQAIITTFHILNSVDVTIGTVQGREVHSRTYWQLVKDLTHGCLYYRTYDYLSVRKLCMADVPDRPSVLLLDKSHEKFEDTFEDVSYKVTQIKDEL